MDPFTASPALDALRTARALLRRADDDLQDVVHRAAGLADETDWRARAADDYRRAIVDWRRGLVDLAVQIDRADTELAEHERRVLTAATDPAP